ncbi:peptidase U32 family protein [Syntrophomonas curvata]
MKLPELLMPAGNLEKLKTAILFGADAVYLGGKDFSLRAAADNFTLEETADGLAFARQHNKKLYVTVNILAHNRDIEELPAYLEKMEEIKVDGLIVSDPGVINLARRYAPSLPLTLSTQASVTNYEAAAFYCDLGVKRIVLARELSLDEIQEIKQRVNIEIEIFIHGAMCVSYSGRCLLSHYMTGRSANSGTCAHPCRYRYALVEEKRPGQYFPIEEDRWGSYILNSRDLCLLEYLPRLIETGIESFKVEGRMKSPLYVASVASVYRQAIDRYIDRREEFSPEDLDNWIEELAGTAARPFTNGFIAGESALLQDINKQEKHARTEFCGIVRGYHDGRNMLQIEQRANFGPGDPLQLMAPGGENLPLQLKELYDEAFNIIDRARHARQTVYIPYPVPLSEYTILRRG